MIRIVLTGGTGFIGSHLLRCSSCTTSNILAIRRSESKKPRLPLKQEPIWLNRELDTIKRFDLQGYDVFIHLAAHSANVPYDSLYNCLHWNLISVLSMFEEAYAAGIRHFIVAGSCFEYGSSGNRYEAIPTNAPLEPTNSYAASKAAASIALIEWANNKKVSLEILRIFHVYGEGELNTRFYPSLYRAARLGEDFYMSSGEQIRDYQPVEAVAKAFLDRAHTILDQGITSTKIYNLSTERFFSLKEFSEMLWDRWNARGSIHYGKVDYRKDEIMRLVPGDNKIIMDLER